MRVAVVFMAVCAGVAAAGDRVCFEAESAGAVVPHMEAVDASVRPGTNGVPTVEGASGNRYLEIRQGKNPAKQPGAKDEPPPGEAKYTFVLDEEGSYLLWARVWWEDECGNSLSMSVDNAPIFAFGQDAIYKQWHWVKAPARLKQLDLKPGEHTLSIRNREDGVKIDQILIVKDRQYVPVGVEEPCGKRP